MGVTKAMTRHLAIFTTCPELGYLLPETYISSLSRADSYILRSVTPTDVRNETSREGLSSVTFPWVTIGGISI